MAERLAQTEAPSIRFHHLGLWGDLMKEYEKKFGHAKPWELKAFDKEYFILGFTRETTNGDIVARKYLEKCSLGGPKEIQKDLAYLNDLVGSTQEQFEQVLDKRNKAFKRIFDIVSENKETVILLTTEPDDLCLSCAVGKHCDRGLLQKITRSDRDFIYLRIFRKLIKKDFKQYASEGAIREYGKDTMSVQGKLLFTPFFHKTISNETAKFGIQ